MTRGALVATNWRGRHINIGERRAEGATLAELARSYGVGKSTISRLAALDFAFERVR